MKLPLWVLGNHILYSDSAVKKLEIDSTPNQLCINESVYWQITTAHLIIVASIHRGVAIHFNIFVKSSEYSARFVFSAVEYLLLHISHANVFIFNCVPCSTTAIHNSNYTDILWNLLYLIKLKAVIWLFNSILTRTHTHTCSNSDEHNLSHWVRKKSTLQKWSYWWAVISYTLWKF